jgi:hypothetical protein
MPKIVLDKPLKEKKVKIPKPPKEKKVKKIKDKRPEFKIEQGIFIVDFN